MSGKVSLGATGLWLVFKALTLNEILLEGGKIENKRTEGVGLGTSQTVQMGNEVMLAKGERRSGR